MMICNKCGVHGAGPKGICIRCYSGASQAEKDRALKAVKGSKNKSAYKLVKELDYMGLWKEV